MSENRALENILQNWRALLDELGDEPAADRLPPLAAKLRAELEMLAQVEKHYLRKENQLFPFLERKGFTGPSQVMWSIHDEVRAQLKKLRAALADKDAATLQAVGREAATAIGEMIYKEENTLFPTALQMLSNAEWVEVRSGEAALGYAWVPP